MRKTILVTGATDGIGLTTAKRLAAQGHLVLLHGRNPDKLAAAAQAVGGTTETYLADLTRLDTVVSLAEQIKSRHDRLDVLINNAGVFKLPDPVTPDGFDARFRVNTLAPYVLTRHLLAIIPKSGRVVNLSSAAQARVDLAAFAGKRSLSDMDAYAQSKLAITIWSRDLAQDLPEGPAIIAVNPGSLLASKMVKEGFGVAGNDLSIGAEILSRAALDDAFATASGQYFDNDSRRFADPDPAALDLRHSNAVMQEIHRITTDIV